MRHLGKVDTQENIQRISNLLSQQGIENRWEMVSNHDWGDAAYGVASYELWIIEEDDLEKAQQIFHAFLENPEKAEELWNLPTPSLEDLPNIKNNFDFSPPKGSFRMRNKRPPMGVITTYILVICAILFIWSEFTTPKMPHNVNLISEANLPLIPLFNAPVKKKLMYDYPRAFVFIDRLVSIYGIDRVLEPVELPTEGKFLIREYEKTPYWHGYYEKFVSFLRNRTSSSKSAVPLFEKIKEGELWRLFTPALLHNDILHIFFNMFWLIILGSQLEARLGQWRYITFTLLAMLISNTAQYLMTGANFIGFSGVLCSMFTFIWMRQRRAPWEGYQLDSMTMGFIMLFIVGMAVLQLISFYLEVQTGEIMGSGVANTAHLAGALLGAVLGRWNLFEWKL